MQVLVFKTDVKHKKHIKTVMPHLQNIEGILRWNIDLHDCDKILRIEASNIAPSLIENTLKQAGYYCEELQD